MVGRWAVVPDGEWVAGRAGSKVGGPVGARDESHALRCMPNLGTKVLDMRRAACGIGVSCARTRMELIRLRKAGA